jgi:hypothetical protein
MATSKLDLKWMAAGLIGRSALLLRVRSGRVGQTSDLSVALFEPPAFDLILAAETRRMPIASKIVKMTDVAIETTVTTPNASICIRPRS